MPTQKNRSSKDNLDGENVFRLSSVALLGLLFISVTAIAKDKIKPVGADAKSSNIYAHVSLANEAEMINSGAFKPSRLTTIGDTTEIMNPAPDLK